MPPELLGLNWRLISKMLDLVGQRKAKLAFCKFLKSLGGWSGFELTNYLFAISTRSLNSLELYCHHCSLLRL